MHRLLRENGLSLVLFLLFVPFLLGQTLTGHRVNNADRADHGKPPLSLGQYLGDAHFWEATSENWESEFLQMFAYVALTAFLFQKGSSESKKLDEPNEVDRDPRLSRGKKDAPGPVRRGGAALWLYERSLTLAFVALFLGSFAVHVVSGRAEQNAERALHGEPALSTTEFLGSAQLWFQSFQNWQSEFLAIGSMVVLTIWLRQRGSPESKPVDAPHAETGE